MKRVIFFFGFSMFSIMLFGQEESCSCTDNPWSAFAYMINEVHESLPPSQEELTAGFQFNNSWSEENYLEETVFEESNNNQPVAQIPNNWNFNFNRTEAVEIISETPDLVEMPKQKEIVENEEEVIEYPELEEKEEELAEIKTVEPINTNPQSRRNINKNEFESEDNSEKNTAESSKSHSSTKSKTKKKLKFPRLKKQKKPKKYKGKCPIF